MFNYIGRNAMRVLLFILMTFFLTACGSETQVTAKLNATKDIKSGDDVFLSGISVAEVVKVEQVNGNTLLTLELNDSGESSIKQNAAVVVNRLKANTPLEIYNKQGEADLVEDGDELKGLNSMFQLGAWVVGDSLNAGSESLSSYVNAFQRYLDGDQFQQDKQVMKSAAQQLGKEVQGATQVLTEEFKKTIKDIGITEEKAAQAIEQFGTELAPVIGELSQSREVVVNELEKFTKNLQEQNPEAKELGKTILSSLLKTLEQVNDNLEPADKAQPQNP